MNQKTHKFTRKATHFYPDILVEYFHTRTRDSGLDVTSFHARIPYLRHNLMSRLSGAGNQLARRTTTPYPLEDGGGRALVKPTHVWRSLRAGNKIAWKFVADAGLQRKEAPKNSNRLQPVL